MEEEIKNNLINLIEAREFDLVCILLEGLDILYSYYSIKHCIKLSDESWKNIEDDYSFIFFDDRFGYDNNGYYTIFNQLKMRIEKSLGSKGSIIDL